MPPKPAKRTPAEQTQPRLSPSEPRSVAEVVPEGNRRASLEALRDRLAAELEDTTWEKHKAECRCVCGMGDGRLVAALSKELRSVLAELDAMPAPPSQKEPLDVIAASVADLDEHRRRAPGRAGTAG
jgi:hypothetical protein